MNFQTIYLFFACAVIFSACQSPSGPSVEKMKETYSMAISYADLTVASQAAYDILVNYPEESSWRDTLVRLYYARKAYPQTILLAEELLDESPEDPRIMALAANAYRAIGNDKKALEHFEALYKVTGEIYHLYEVANVQYNLKRVGECTATADRLLQHKDIESKLVDLRFNNQNQKVPIKAAVLNLKGVLAKDLGNTKEARAFFQQALDIFPEYLLAQGNLESLEQ